MSVRIDMDGEVAVVRLARPPVNAMTLDVLGALIEAFVRVRKEKAAGLVLAGEGACFSAGFDTKAFEGYGRDERREMFLRVNRMLSVLLEFEGPVVAALGGHAMGGGLVLALAADVRLVGDGAEGRLALAEVTAGVPYPEAALEVVKARLPPQLAQRLVLTGAPLSFAEARALGLAETASGPDDLTAQAIERARALSRLAGYSTVKAQWDRALLAAAAATPHSAGR